MAGCPRSQLKNIPLLCQTKEPQASTKPCETEGSKGVGARKPCVFPFTYNSKTYSSCPIIDHTGPWCATKVSATGSYMSGQWGDCGWHCPQATTPCKVGDGVHAVWNDISYKSATIKSMTADGSSVTVDWTDKDSSGRTVTVNKVRKGTVQCGFEQVEVRCMKSDGSAPKMKTYGCWKHQSYTKAVSQCGSKSLQIPTLAQVQSNSMCGTGCGYDAQRIWTSTPCTS